MNHKEALKKCDVLIARIQDMKKSIEADMKSTPQDRLSKAADDIIRQLKSGSLSVKPQPPQAVIRNSPANLEKMQAQRLANTLQASGILGTRPPPRQPTDQELFGHLVPSEDTLQKAEQQWGNGFNNWLAEATKPINSRFKTPEEEEAYWNNIKVEDSGTPSGY